MKSKTQKVQLKVRLQKVGGDLRALFGHYDLVPDHIVDVTDDLSVQDMNDFKALFEDEDKYINVDVSMTCDQAINLFNKYSYGLARVINDGYGRSADKSREE